MVIGTAGHIDHGKTALVRALTGVDTDRLPEEQRRGITIELGFAPLELEGIGTAGVVDVPGHEAFVRTMVAGAAGVDIALLVIAADEGVMPQTREHLAILSLLGVRGGVVALNKCDLVADEWLELVEGDVQSLLPGSVLDGAPVVRVSARTGTGLESLRACIRERAERLSLARSDDLFRLPLDRVFTLKGTGTVVTGTVWSGTLRRGSAWVFPPGRSVRVRDLQSHGRKVESVGRGMRAAVALSDVSVEEIPRGAVLVDAMPWLASDTMRATLTLLDSAGAGLGARTQVRLHLGSTETGARIVRLGAGQVRLHLEEALLCRSGDRFIIRGGARLTTLGGGVVLDPHSRRRARALPAADLGPAALLAALAEEAGPGGVALQSLPVRVGIAPADADALLQKLPLVRTDERVYADAVAVAARSRLLRLVDATHTAEPLSRGVPLESARQHAGVPPDLFERALADLVGARAVVSSAGFIHRLGWEPQLSEEQAALAKRLMHAFCSTEEPRTDVWVAEHFGAAALPVLRHLEREGSVVRLGEALLAGEPIVRTMVERLRGHMRPGRAYSPAELRDALGVSRKVLIPLLEYCDRVRLTERRGAERVLRG